MSQTGQEESHTSPTYSRGLVQHLFAARTEDETELFFTTNPGLEDVVAEEFHRRVRDAGLESSDLERKPFGLGGHVLARCPHPFAALEPIAWQMRSIHHVLHPLYGFPLPSEDPLEKIHAELLGLDIPEMCTAASFRVTSKRVGEHSFTSVDVQKVAGAALVEHYACAVSLKNFALNVRVDVYDQLCLVSLQLTERSLSKRYIRVYQPRTALKTPVAYAMLQFAELENGGGPLLDPFCGSGTILIEAAQLFSDMEIYGSDFFPEAVEGARFNIEDLGLSERIQIRQVDARALGKDYPADYFRAIVTNPPYGVHVGRKLHFPTFYRIFLEQAWKVLVPGGMLALMVWKRGIFSRVLREFGRFRQRHVRVVETGHLFPRIFVLEKFSGKK